MSSRMKRLKRNTSVNMIYMIVLIVLLAAAYVYNLVNQFSLVPRNQNDEISNQPPLKTFRQSGSEYRKSNRPRLETFGQSGNDNRKSNPKATLSTEPPIPPRRGSTDRALKRNFVPVGDNFCVPWEVNADEWWTHSPAWKATEENRTHACFALIASEKDRNLTEAIYRNQWDGNCSDVYTRQMYNSGWVADFRNVGFGLVKAMEQNTPFTIQEDPSLGFWHYSANKEDASNPTCPAKNMTCYFLNLGACSPKEPDLNQWMPTHSQFRDYGVAYKYATRHRQWLRRAVYQSTQAMDAVVTPPCSVVHVRRSDVVLHATYSRKYFPLSDYVDLIPADRRNETIFLLTDDANAVDEAHEFFPAMRWQYFNRTRYRAVEGGWEMQVPSKNPKMEVLIILATFRLVHRCDVFIHGHGGFSGAIMDAMSRKTREFRVDNKKNPFNRNNSRSHLELEKALAERRQNVKS